MRIIGSALILTPWTSAPTKNNWSGRAIYLGMGLFGSTTTVVRPGWFCERIDRRKERFGRGNGPRPGCWYGWEISGIERRCLVEK